MYHTHTVTPHPSDPIETHKGLATTNQNDPNRLEAYQWAFCINDLGSF